MEKSVSILLGNYGSGKTEISLNLAIQGARRGLPSILVDLDIVNPFFRSGYHGELLRREGVRLVVSRSSLDAADVPVVAPDVLAAFDSDFGNVVFDVGGNPVGATALGQYRHKFATIPPENLHVLLAVNVFRPLTATVADIREMLDNIRRMARLPVTGLVNNSNLARESGVEHLLAGDAILREVADREGIPVTHYGVDRALAEGEQAHLLASLSGTAIPLEIYTKLDWDDFRPQLGC